MKYIGGLGGGGGQLLTRLENVYYSLEIMQMIDSFKE